jgi:predicted nucleic acid-binding protein
VGPALKLAFKYRHSVYDGLYLALAMSKGWNFVTADEKLYRLLNPGFSLVTLLRDWS